MQDIEVDHEYDGEAIGYVRYSTKEQSKGISYTRQKEDIEAYCVKNNFKLIKTYRDLGLSAYRGTNRLKGEFGKLLEDLELGVVKPNTYLVVESFDRISRDKILTQYTTYLNLLTNGISIITLSDIDDSGTPMVHYHDKHPKHPKDQSSLMISIIISLSIMLRANNESSRKSDLAQKNWQRKKKEALANGEALSSICPSWMKLEEGEYKIVNKRKRVVQKILILYSRGKGYNSIANTLLRDNTLLFTSVNMKKRVKNWTSSKVKSIIKSHALYGAFKSQDGITKIEGLYPKILSKDDYFNLIISQQKTTVLGGDTSRFLNCLRSIVKCGVCGSNLNYYTSKNGKWESKALRCEPCGMLVARYEQSLVAVIEILSGQIGQLIYNKSANTKAQIKKNNSITAQISEINKEILILKKRKMDTGRIATGHIIDMIENFSEEIEKLESRLIPVKEIETLESLFGGEILTNGFLETTENRKILNGHLHTLIGKQGITAYRYSQNNFSLLINTPYPTHISVYRKTQRQPWTHNTIETLTSEDKMYGKVGLFSNDHEVRNQICKDYGLPIYSRLP